MVVCGAAVKRGPDSVSRHLFNQRHDALDVITKYADRQVGESCPFSQSVGDLTIMNLVDLCQVSRRLQYKSGRVPEYVNPLMICI